MMMAIDKFHHKLYNLYINQTSKFMTYDKNKFYNIGDRVSPL
ncbi:hypothetical protein NC653_033804 [Populus alba x Populus x berolinensis]|uniref:Uncharacterized protein n=1 Tax=Populus alba x Populus x berolinensis TaxID=444605 RepID=A0AAD6PZK6_9ROSI|nr:hypothetical protein NC653_033804 [Populus alba x Populus x berolinensis]